MRTEPQPDLQWTFANFMKLQKREQVENVIKPSNLKLSFHFASENKCLTNVLPGFNYWITQAQTKNIMYLGYINNVNFKK